MWRERTFCSEVEALKLEVEGIERSPEVLKGRSAAVRGFCTDGEVI
jgi:hypothetical protein